MTNRNRSCALAVAFAALWTGAEASGESNALWQLPEDERYYLLRLAGGEDRVENHRSGHFRSSAGRPLTWWICQRYVRPERRDSDPEDWRSCIEEFPPMVLKRMYSYGYKDVKLADVADLETFSFFREMTRRLGKKTREESNKFELGYLAFKKRLGVYMIGDRAVEDSLKPPKK